MAKPKMKRIAGFSVVETLLAVGIISFSLLASVSFFSQLNKSMQHQNSSLSRIRLFHSLINILGMPATLRGSLKNDTPNGIKLRESVRNGLGTLPSAPLPVALHLPVVAGNATTVVTSGKITGTPDQPVLYSLEGAICIPGVGSVCDPTIYSIRVITHFMPVCPPEYDYYNGVWSGPIYPTGLAIPTSCNRAQYIKIYYTFEPTPGAPLELNFTPVTGTIMVSAVMANIHI